jgi:hypothetical protein
LAIGVANPARTCPIKPRPLYVVVVTEPQPEPTIADVLAAIAAQGEVLTALTTKVDGLTAKVDIVGQDVMAVKVDMGFIDRHIDDFQRWARRHEENPGAHAA